MKRSYENTQLPNATASTSATVDRWAADGRLPTAVYRGRVPFGTEAIEALTAAASERESRKMDAPPHTSKHTPKQPGHLRVSRLQKANNRHLGRPVI